MPKQTLLPRLIAITTGDPAGIGPEISLRLLSDRGFGAVAEGSQPVLIGDIAWLRQTARDFSIQIELAPVARFDRLHDTLRRNPECAARARRWTRLGRGAARGS